MKIKWLPILAADIIYRRQYWQVQKKAPRRSPIIQTSELLRVSIVIYYTTVFLDDMFLSIFIV